MDIYSKISSIIEHGESAVLITVVEKAGEGPVAVGKKMLVESNGSLSGTVGGGALEHYAVDKANSILKGGDSLLEEYSLNEGKIVDSAVTLPMECGGKVTLFYEKIGGAQSIYIFGGGHVGAAVSRVLEPLGFYTRIIDDREDVLSALDTGKQKICAGFAEYASETDLDGNAYVLVSTPSHQYDFDVVSALVEKNIMPKYLGVLASSRKKTILLDRLGPDFSPDESSLYCPVGLDTGGASPEEIAVSIASEILSVKYNKSGHRHLKDTK